MAHIGNGHQQTPAFAAAYLGGFAIHRIVKVAGIFAVNRDQRHIAQINPVLAVLGQHFVRQALGLLNATRRKLMGHAVLAHRDLDLHARVVDLTQHFLDAAHRLTEQGRRLGQLDHHHLPRLGRARCTFGDHHILAVALVLGRDQPQAAFLQQAANDGLLRALDDLDDAPFRPAFAVLTDDANLDAIPVKHRPHFIGGQINVRFAAVTNQEPVTIPVSLHTAFDFFQQAAGLS